MQCVIAEQPDLETSESCFDPGSGVLLRHEDPGTVIELSEFTQHEGKIIPRRILVLLAGEHHADLRMEDLVLGRAPDPALFDPPEDAVSRPWCADIVHATLASAPYLGGPPPPEFRAATAPQNVWASALVDSTGLPKEVRLAAPATRHRQTVVLEGVEPWRFKPATCDGAPVPDEVYILVRFRG